MAAHPNWRASSHTHMYPLAHHVSADNTSPDFHPTTTSCCHSTSINVRDTCMTKLPKHILVLLNNPQAHSTAFISDKLQPCTSLLVANTGAMDHMIPNKSAFISYHPVTGCVRMGNNSSAPILDTGLAIISLNGKHILIWDCLHVPALRNPLYSLWAHQHQHGCGFIGMHQLGMYIFFPSFIVKVNTATDCNLSYKPIGRSTTMSSLDYIQPVQTPSLASNTDANPSIPAIVEDYKDEDYCLPTYATHWPKKYDMSLFHPQHTLSA
jgi:hypothetical protein